MALLKRLTLLSALLLSGCVAEATNTALVYKPINGTIDMAITIPAGESFAKVQFQADGNVVSEDTDGTDGYSATVDTTTLPANTLVKIAAVGVHTDGSQVVLRENFVLIGDDGVKDDSNTPNATDASAQPSSTASGTKTTTGTGTGTGTKALKIGD